MTPSTLVPPAALSLAQERFLVVNRLVGDAPLHNLPVGWRIRGSLDLETLSRALAHLTERHDVLRTRFPILEDGSGAQEVLAGWRPTLEVVTVPEGTEDARARSLRAWRERTASRPFSLTSEPAFAEATRATPFTILMGARELQSLMEVSPPDSD